ncbi:hypothetical protein E2C01_036406 [Portunus trituberculatus]|uniref:Uncharacterized protein n=1 Tax=Portunus trituberculatus TaxID=210409 RepID=A0A5B7FBA1_PORTR|nr:hypothetical protein [Portunus trituberculatus]
MIGRFHLDQEGFIRVRRLMHRVFTILTPHMSF